MKIRKNGMETFLYCVACIITLGTLWLLRMAITAGIKHALKED
jgi:hypothetical protein